MECMYEEQIKKIKEAHSMAVASVNRDNEERLVREKEKYEHSLKEVCVCTRLRLVYLHVGLRTHVCVIPLAQPPDNDFYARKIRIQLEKGGR